MLSNRSSGGCWTCKLRKKKCDEAKPLCLTCRSLSLECSGYGSRPVWMDGQSKEREELVRIRETVKQVTSRKKRVAMQRRVTRSASENYAKLRIGINSRLSASHMPGPSAQLAVSDFSQKDLPCEPSEVPLLIDALPSSLSPEDVSSYILQNESILIMHYLDNVFPCQFRFYQHSLEEGGRGWLLSLLMQNKPLYHAACSLAAYHRQLLYCKRGGMAKACFTNEAMHHQYDLAIMELRRYVEELAACDRERTLAEDVHLLCSIVLFISLEAFISRPGSWRVHLTAAVALFPTVYRQLQQAPLSSDPIAHPALVFFTSVAYWFDIISSTTIGSKPFDLVHPSMQAYIHFDKILGCANWTMLAVKNIASLDHWKNMSKATETLSLRELFKRGNAIETLLTNGLEEVLSATRYQYPRNREETEQEYISLSVTRVYCCAALIYLHTVIYEPCPSLPVIQQSVAQAIKAFKALPDPRIVDHLVWPLCIVGCMAMECDEVFLRSLAPSAEAGDEMLHGASKARIIFEECWRLRRYDGEGRMVDWRIAMKNLDFDILLK